MHNSVTELNGVELHPLNIWEFYLNKAATPSRLQKGPPVGTQLCLSGIQGPLSVLPTTQLPVPPGDTDLHTKGDETQAQGQ